MQTFTLFEHEVNYDTERQREQEFEYSVRRTTYLDEVVFAGQSFGLSAQKPKISHLGIRQ